MAEFARLVELARLFEAWRQAAAMRRGLASVVPAPLLALLGWRDVERRVCGEPHIDVELLRRHTECSPG